MYQEVQATIVLTYSADATLSRAQLRKRILLVEAQLERLREEAQIYSDGEGVTP
jgi:hypothetical protein